MSTESAASRAYDRLHERLKEINYLRDSRELLNWDQQVMMPEGGGPARAKQQSAMSSVIQERLADDEVGRLLNELEDAELSDRERAVVRDARRSHEHATRVPPELTQKLTEISSRAQQEWQAARSEDDFGTFAPTLETLRDLHVERAEHIDDSRDPYRVMFEGVDPELSLSLVEEILDDIRDSLVPLLERARTRDREFTDPFAGDEFEEDDQRALAEELLDELGYDWDRGRLDTSPHPVTMGSQYDCRITTRFDESDPLDGLLATIHEFGHASYQLGLPQDEYGSPLGRSHRNVHESQSRFWENHVGRTRAFWERYASVLNDHLGTDATPRRLSEVVNRLTFDNPIRVEADELTYHLHVLVRTEVEKRFVSGDIDASEIPSVWNDKMERYLGVRPETDAEGCLQDIHWTGGFANFQSYTIGSVLAAQLDAALRADLDADVDRLIRSGEFDPLREWMSREVHRRGRRYPADELIERATGEPLTAEYFIEYAEEKFGDLYGV